MLAEYFALLEYKLQRRDELDRRIEEIALTPRYKHLDCPRPARRAHAR